MEGFKKMEELIKEFDNAVPSGLKNSEAIKSIDKSLKIEPVKDIQAGLQELVSAVKEVLNPPARVPVRRTGPLNDLTFENAIEALKELASRVWGTFVILDLQIEAYNHHIKHADRYDEETLKATQTYTDPAKTVLDAALARFTEKEAQELLDYPIQDLAPSLQAPKEDLQEATDKLKLARWEADVTIITSRKLHEICHSLRPEGPEKWVKE